MPDTRFQVLPFVQTFMVVAVLASGVPRVHAHNARGPFEWASVRLDFARREKAEQLGRFCLRLRGLAGRAAQDARVAAFFDLNRKVSQAGESAIPDKVAEQVRDARESFDRYYIENYFAFYDILFIDAAGRVFYSLRKEADLYANLLGENFADLPLGRCIAASPQELTFVDFHIYGPSAEPAAFFVAPVRAQGQSAGWIALQCAINRVNALFVSTRDLGRTGETFLVNSDGYLLTESHFTGITTILKQRLDVRNIQAKFQARRGHLTVTDYRGARALTSFEVFSFMSTEWLIVAKIDRAEVATDHFLQHHRYYGDKLKEYLRTHTPAPPQAMDLLPRGQVLRIDMDEYLRAGQGETLETFGVSTCTGLIAALPGQFAYMAHISPKDRLYGGSESDLLGQMARKIRTFERRPFERGKVVFILVAPHLEALDEAIHRLLAEGFLLSQIRVLYYPGKHSAGIVYHYPSGALRVSWRPEGGSTPADRAHGLEASRDLGESMREIMANDKDPSRR